ncbi:MAG TPA: ABC transporter permease, partial [Verrucomicrobiae bacterium]|nr:ABC transporter permease [Verrucomicrobiae bacterium]
LPAKDPSRLIRVYTRQERPESPERAWVVGSSYPDYVDIRDGSGGVFSGVAAEFHRKVSLVRGDEPELGSAALVSGNYFDVLGVPAALGRTFTAEEDGVPGAHPVVVLSHAAFRDRFASDPSAIGRQLTLNGRAFTIVGVAPPWFQGIEAERAPEVWVPMAMQAAVIPSREWLTARGAGWLAIFGRLEKGVTLDQARASLEVTYARLAATYPETNKGRTPVVETAGRLGREDRGKVVAALVLLLVVAALVLLVACANVAGLLLSRSASREKELAIRVSLGASRGRIVRQLLTEGLLLSLAGGACAIVIAGWSADLLHTLSLPPSIDLGLDVRVVAFTVATCFATTLVFGLAPARRATRRDVAPVLGAASRSSSSSARSHSLLSVAQIGLSLVLLITAGLFLRSVQKAQSVHPGFDPEHVLTFALDPGLQGYGDARGRELYARLLERIGATPGVVSATVAGYVPLGHAWQGDSVIVEGSAPVTDEAAPTVGVNPVGPGYFATLRLPLARGREFTRADSGSAPGVVVVNETMARKFWPDGEAIGRRLKQVGKDQRWLEVVGVAADSKYLKLVEESQPMMYLPFEQAYESEAHLLVRTAGDPEAAAAALRHEVTSLDRSLPVFSVQSLASLAVDAEERRLTATLLAIFGGLGLLLAAVGLYGLIASLVAGRTREIGVRVALGAEPSSILRLFLAHGAKLVAAGLVLGSLLAFAATRLLQESLFGVTPTDAVTFGLVSLVLAATGLAATWIPARRASRVDPIVALRSE